MLTSHAVLQKYWYDSRYSFSEIVVCYVDRGAPGDRSCVRGSEILSLQPYYFEVLSWNDPKYIPYHRIRKITYAGKDVWKHQIG